MKNIGFRRNIYLSWMDAAAAYAAETDDLETIRRRLAPLIAEIVRNEDNQRVAADILVNIWHKSRYDFPELHTRALRLLDAAQAATDRLWLHYGMALLTYDFFRLGAITIGELSRFYDEITPREVKQRMTAEMGQLGALEKAVERVIFSLRNWGFLSESEQRFTYVPVRRQFAASSIALEAWMLSACLSAHPAEELPFSDLLRLPELFPFRFELTVDHLRQMPGFAIQRQGMGWDMVRLVKYSMPT